MSKKFFLSFLLVFVVLTVFASNIEKMLEGRKITKEINKSKKQYRYRKYLHVKKFYQNITKNAIDIGLRYNIPPPALLAIAGVESGYGRGYVAKITGNILSLGAKKGEARLPGLYLPNTKDDDSKVLYGDTINRYKKNELIWKKRPKSLKKDYRPKNIAGTTKQLDFLDKNPISKKDAQIECMRDFAKNWISKKKKFKPFIEARKMLDKEVLLHSKDILFDRDLNIKFIYMISGKKNSFNYRKTWAPKVTNIMKNVGLIELTKLIHNSKTFNQSW